MSRLSVRATSALTLLTLLTAQLPALAQSKPEQIDSGLSPERGSEEAVEQARKLVEEGDALMKKSKFADGTAKYRAAWNLHATYFTACKAGRGEAQLEHFPEAATFLAYCLKHFTLSDDSKQKSAEKKYRGLQADVLKKVGRVTVDLSPKHASLSIDGDQLDDELFEGELFVSPGDHDLHASATGFVSAGQKVSVAAGASTEAALKLEVEKATAAPVATPSPSGSAAPPPEATPEAPQDQGGSMATRNIVVITGGVLAVGALVGSFVFRAKAADKSDQLSELRMGRFNDECATVKSDFCKELDSLQSDRESAAGTSNILLGVGVGLGVASVAAFFLWPKPKQDQAKGAAIPSAGLRGIDVVVDQDRASLGFRGAF